MMKKQIRFLMACIMTVVLIGTFSTKVYAEIMYETEPNDSKETAELILANNETAQGAAEGTYAGQYVVRGYASQTDSDWYKVYLEAGTQYMTCNDNAFNYVIEDEAGNILLADTYITSGFGPTAYIFNVSEAGYYYVKITGVTSVSSAYRFLIGGPTYSIASCEISCKEGTVLMTSGIGTKTIHFDGQLLTELPKDAIAYSVTLSGVTTTSFSGARITNEKTGQSFSLTRYSWRKDKLVSMNMPVASIWKANLDYSKNTSFTPVLRIFYAYPVYDTVVQ